MRLKKASIREIDKDLASELLYLNNGYMIPIFFEVAVNNVQVQDPAKEIQSLKNPTRL